jgi:hypothetical protein
LEKWQFIQWVGKEIFYLLHKKQAKNLWIIDKEILLWYWNGWGKHGKSKVFLQSEKINILEKNV